MVEETLGQFLRSARQAAGFTLRKVEELTDRRVKNGYLSQIEGGAIRTPSTHVLNELARVYKVEYEELLRRAGLPVGGDRARPAGASARIGAIPLSALEDLSAAEARQLLDYVAFIKSQRPR